MSARALKLLRQASSSWRLRKEKPLSYEAQFLHLYKPLYFNSSPKTAWAQQGAGKNRTVQIRRMASTTTIRSAGGDSPELQMRAPAAVGDSIDDLDTPALIVDLDVMEENMRKMARTMAQFPGVSVRAHAKAHKCVEIALSQMKLSGAVGVCCQKLGEAEVMAHGGVRDILISNEIVPRGKIRRLMEVAKKAKVAVVVDDAGNASALSEEAQAAGVELRVLVEVNVGQNRCGVDGPEAALSLARHVAALPNLQFHGIQAYHGGIQHVRALEERTAHAAQVAEQAQTVASTLREAGLLCSTVTGGGTGTYLFEASSGVYTEVQPGSYIFGDVDYSKNVDACSPSSAWGQSLFIIATVMSRSFERKTVVVDAGLKAVSFDSGPPVVDGPVGPHLTCSNGGDEHCILHLNGESLSDAFLPELGSKVKLIPGHCDPTVNMHDYLVGIRGGVVESVWEIAGRGPGF